MTFRSLTEHRSVQTFMSFSMHILSAAFLLFCISIINYLNYMLGAFKDQKHLAPVEWYGYTGCVVLYIWRFIPYISLPFVIMNIFGIVSMNLWPVAPKLQVSKSNLPFLCFRVVTRGLFPELVQANVQRNIGVCNKVGLDNFKFEVVTDKQLNLQKSPLIRELLVPPTYATKNNSLYKARALQYCLEMGVDILSDHDWIVHLDEETVMTEESVIGLANFAGKGLDAIGQGVITYANEVIVNWWTTLSDSVRVSVDLGMMRFCLKKLNCPAMGFKGSYIIVKGSVEKEIGFDFGPKGSISEDIYFSLMAWKKGFQFNFVEGEMWEKSPFSLQDYIKQRKRWFVGHLFTLLSSEIPLKCKLGLIPTDLGWLLLSGTILSIPVSMVFPIPIPLILNVITGSIGGVMFFLFVFGSIKSFSLRKYGLVRKCLICLWTVICIPLAACMDATASLYGVCSTNSIGFDIVKKDINSASTYTNNSVV